MTLLISFSLWAEVLLFIRYGGQWELLPQDSSDPLRFGVFMALITIFLLLISIIFGNRFWQAWKNRTS